MLQDKFIGIYCLVDDILKGIEHREHKECQVSDSEIMKTAILSAPYFKGNHSHAIGYMRSHNMIPVMIGKTGFSKRLDKLPALLMWMFLNIGMVFKYACAELEYIIGSFPCGSVITYESAAVSC